MTEAPSKREDVGCQELAEWRIEHGDSPDDYTESCTEHLPHMIADVEAQTLYRIHEPVPCCYIAHID